MLGTMPPHRILIMAVLALVFGSVMMHIKWANIPKIFAAFSQMVPSGGAATPAPAGETVVALRDRLKDEALAAGRQALADPCNPDARKGYHDALISLARQRMRDMGCTFDFNCNIENGFKEVSLAYYATDKDRQISYQFAAVAAKGGIGIGELGIYQVFIGHPAELGNMTSTIPLVRAPACAGARGG